MRITNGEIMDAIGCSERVARIFEGVCLGLGDREIAEKIGLRRTTVRSQLQRSRRKLGHPAGTRASLARVIMHLVHECPVSVSETQVYEMRRKFGSIQMARTAYDVWRGATAADAAKDLDVCESTVISRRQRLYSRMRYTTQCDVAIDVSLFLKETSR